MKRLFSLILTTALAFSLTACGSTSSNDSSSSFSSVGDSSAQESEISEVLPEAEIQVFIAASLSNAFDDIVSLYAEQQPNVTVTLNADSSGTLLAQIQEGFTCDIFFSAAVKQMNALEADGLAIEGSRVDLLRNQLVLITYRDSDTGVTGLADLANASSMALCDGSVPAGKYTRAALQSMGVLDSEVAASEIDSSTVSEALGGLEINETSNVSKTLEAVAEGSNEVGTVYYSDAYSRIDSIEILEMISTDLTGEILYPMCRVVNQEATEAVTAAADDFYQFLQSDEVMAVFETYLFLPNE